MEDENGEEKKIDNRERERERERRGRKGGGETIITQCNSFFREERERGRGGNL